MIIRHIHRIYYLTREHPFTTIFENNSSRRDESLSTFNGHYQYYRFPRQRIKPSSVCQQEERLIHRTIRRLSSIVHRRRINTPQRSFHVPLTSISYPFVRRRHDDGRTRTAFAIYGLPFPIQPTPRSNTISSTPSLMKKTLLF
jgi:hypothetical protein